MMFDHGWQVAMVSPLKRFAFLSVFAAIVSVALTPRARAGLEFREVSADAHTVLSGQPLVHRFQFQNNDGFTDIVGVRTSCGCLEARPTKYRYGPGETGAIELKINTLGQSPGPHRWIVRVTERSESADRETALELTADVKAEVSVQPASLEIYTQGTVSHELILTDTRPRPLAITRLLTSSGSLRASFEPIDGQAGSWRIHVSLADSMPEGRHHESLVIITSDDFYRELHIPITVIKQAVRRVSASPCTLAIAAADGQPLPTPTIVLRDTLEEPVRIDSIAADSQALDCRWASGPGNSATIRVHVDRSRFAGDSLDSQITITLASPRSEPLVIPIHCTIR
jgi:Protein of unknown function (DUF1573)